MIKIFISYLCFVLMMVVLLNSKVNSESIKGGEITSQENYNAESYNKLEKIIYYLTLLNNIELDNKLIESGDPNNNKYLNKIRFDGAILSIWDCIPPNNDYSEKSLLTCKDIKIDKHNDSRCFYVEKSKVDNTIMKYFDIDTSKYEVFNTHIKEINDPDFILMNGFSFDGNQYHICDYYSDDLPRYPKIDDIINEKNNIIKVTGSIKSFEDEMIKFTALFNKIKVDGKYYPAFMKISYNNIPNNINNETDDRYSTNNDGHFLMLNTYKETKADLHQINNFLIYKIQALSNVTINKCTANRGNIPIYIKTPITLQYGQELTLGSILIGSTPPWLDISCDTNLGNAYFDTSKIR